MHGRWKQVLCADISGTGNSMAGEVLAGTARAGGGWWARTHAGVLSPVRRLVERLGRNIKQPVKIRCQSGVPVGKIQGARQRDSLFSGIVL